MIAEVYDDEEWGKVGDCNTPTFCKVIIESYSNIIIINGRINDMNIVCN